MKKEVSYFNIIKKIWKSNRWELFLFLSIVAIIFCYFFVDQEEYKGLQTNYLVLDDNISSSKKKNKNQEECRKVVEEIFKVPFKTVRPDFLKNPKTGRNLELDMYNENLKIAVEYQGAQHRTYTPFFHKSVDDFNKQVERDQFKKEKCKEKGIELICVPDDVKRENMYSYIYDKLKEVGKINN